MAISTQREDGLFWITIDRPHVHNAIDSSTHLALQQAFDDYANDNALRCAVLTAAGGATFCAGSDLKERAGAARDAHPATGFGGLTRRFDLHKPVIAAVNGAAIGGGFELVLACDLAIAVEHATFCLPEPQVGLAATGGGGLQRLVRDLPWKVAADIALAGRVLSATEALTWGLINAVVAPHELRSTTNDFAHRVLRGSPLAIEASKAVMQGAVVEGDLRRAITRSYPHVERLLDSDEAREGMQAFIEKRRPSWRR